MRFGGKLTFEQNGEVAIEVEIEPARMSAESIVVRRKGPATREGLGVGSTFEELRRAYGEPTLARRRALYGTCRQYARPHGVDFCSYDDGPVGSIVIPALQPSPLAIGEDLAAFSAALEGLAIAGGTYRAAAGNPKVVAPCMLAVREVSDGQTQIGYRSVIAHRGEVYETRGGWRRPDRSIVMCDTTDASVYDVDPAGHATRWNLGFDEWRPEPAECTVTDRRVTCRGVTQMTDGFTGVFSG